MKQYRLIEDSFSPLSAALRAEFDSKFADPKATRSDRFVWDFWNVPGQYTHLRTPAEHFFSRKNYGAFLRQLGDWARLNLGCSAITPPWLSYYVEGCEQNLHSDVPHGPWAFVYSLSPRKRVFQGGETLLLRPETLDYWRNFASAQDRELNSFVERIEPRFNRLVVFDPRIPHGVTRVSGTMDPREARLVMHGWFTDPRPCVQGALSARQAAPVLDEAVGSLADSISSLGIWHGILSLRLAVSKSGGVSGVKILADTLVPVSGDPAHSALIRRNALAALNGLRFPRAKGASAITLPLLFR
ncbi:MAG: 2OG-Fe(II) oxygenase [Bdellovibrionota bacterium]